MNLWFAILDVLLTGALIYFSITSVYLFSFAVLGNSFYRPPAVRNVRPVTRFYILIPSYKSEKVAIESLKQALAQDYPRELFKAVLIADAFAGHHLTEALKTGAIVLPVKFENSTKAQALNVALEKLPAWADSVVVLDVDNIMDRGALLAFDQAIQSGYPILQAHRTAKNLNTHYANLDAIGEEINNTIFRKGQRAAGFNAALSGSGMVFPYKMFRELMRHMKAVGGFDKELEMELIRRKQTVEYLDYVKVYDEKVQKAEVLKKQRKRWIAAQFHYVKHYASRAFEAVKALQPEFLLKYLQLLLLPRVLHFALLSLLSAISWFSFSPEADLILDLIQVCFVFYLLAMLLALPPSYYTDSTLRALLRLPRTALLYIQILCRLKGANDNFLHTPHELITTKKQVP